ncbi:MAG TPA: hypothetical protein VGF31_06010 [Myxococcaceae bacterium]
MAISRGDGGTARGGGMDGGIVSFVMFWSVVGGVTLLVLAARRVRRSWP